jgi:hypothetical protein
MGYLIFLKYIRALASQLFSEDPRLNDVIDEVTLDRKKATDFLKYRRWFWPDIDEECYRECCSREEVDEHFSTSNAVSMTNFHIN